MDFSFWFLDIINKFFYISSDLNSEFIFIIILVVFYIYVVVVELCLLLLGYRFVLFYIVVMKYWVKVMEGREGTREGAREGWFILFYNLIVYFGGVC